MLDCSVELACSVALAVTVVFDPFYSLLTILDSEELVALDSEVLLTSAALDG